MWTNAMHVRTTMAFPETQLHLTFWSMTKCRLLTANVNVTVHAASDANTPKEEFEDYEDDSLINLTLVQVL